MYAIRSYYVDRQRLAVVTDIAPARLHRCGRQPVVDNVDADDMVRSFESPFRLVAVSVFEIV